METKNGTAKGTQKTLVLQRTFDLPVSTVWQAWTEPESFKKWWGPKDYTCPDCNIDLTEGGKYLASMQDKKNGKKMWSAGIYKHIEPMNKLVYTDNFSDEKGNPILPPPEIPGNWFQPLLVTVELKHNNGRTDMTLTQESMPEEAYDDCVAGWQECFDKLAQNLL